MADQRETGIAWTDETWNPLRGCSRVSEGCRNCYAETVAGRFSGPGQPYEGLVRLAAEGKHGRARWNGQVRFLPEKLSEPLRWTRPRMVFVNSMSDLFHESVPFEQIAAIFGVMAASQQHTFQVLTKRPARAREFLAWLLGDGSVGHVWQTLYHFAKLAGADERKLGENMRSPWPWPLPNVWLGVSVEDQANANGRIPHLLHSPAAVRWVSYEPAIGPVDFTGIGRRSFSRSEDYYDATAGLDWIVVGGESGPGARPFDLAWARSVIAQAKGTGCRVFVKQMGSRPADGWSATVDAPLRALKLDDRKGGDPNEWPEDLRVREWPEVSRG